MRKGIVILTHEDTRFNELIELNISLFEACNIDYIIASNSSNSKYERLGLEAGMISFDEFILLQDSVIIKNIDLIKQMLDTNGSVWLSNWGQNYFCKYRTGILKQLELPNIKSKLDSVKYERDFHETYKKLEKPIVLMDGCLENTNIFEEAYGRLNMISENEYFKKYKGTWDISLINN